MRLKLLSITPVMFGKTQSKVNYVIKVKGKG